MPHGMVGRRFHFFSFSSFLVFFFLFLVHHKGKAFYCHLIFVKQL